jgi:hypothetical protein
MNCTIVMMVRSMTLDSANVVSQALWAEAYSTAVHIKNCLPHYTFKLNTSLYEIMFGDRPLIKYLYLFGAKCYVYISEDKQIRTYKLSPRGIKYYVVGYTESYKMF